MARICIYPKDIQMVTGKSERYGRGIILMIKKHLNKEKHQLVTIDEFCKFMGMEISKVEYILR